MELFKNFCCCHSLMLSTMSNQSLASFFSSLAISSGEAKVPGPKFSKSRLLSSSWIELERSSLKRGSKSSLLDLVTMADTRGGKERMPEFGNSQVNRPEKIDFFNSFSNGVYWVVGLGFLPRIYISKQPPSTTSRPAPSFENFFMQYIIV